MIKFFSIVVCCFNMVAAQAQPYIDIASLEYVKSPNIGMWRHNSQGNRFDYYNVSTNFPLVNKRDSSIIVFSPFAERWNIQIEDLTDLPDYVQSLAFPITLIKPLSKKINMAISAIPRWNGEKALIFKNYFQLGGAFVVSYKKQYNLTYKIGLYYNSELSGAYFVPLFGIDWRINAKNKLFGILPGNLVFEHKLNKSFYWGASFNAITNTYTAGLVNNNSAPKYLRIEDNEVSFLLILILKKT